MDKTTLIETLQTYLDNNLTVEVQSEGAEENRPMPGVIFDGFTLRDLTFHNSHLAAVTETGAGSSDERWYRFHYTANLSWLVRDRTDYKASALHDQLRSLLEEVVLDRSIISEDLNEAKLAGGGGISHEFVENTESEMSQSLYVRTFDQRHKNDFDSLDEIREIYTLDYK